jgi:drug/metabolite transporter (DMT)-like permease
MKDWGFLIGSGFFLALHFLLWFESLKHTTVASSTIILALQPIVSLVGGFFLFKERTTYSAKENEVLKRNQIQLKSPNLSFESY